jgi:hypothetical protein
MVKKRPCPQAIPPVSAQAHKVLLQGQEGAFQDQEGAFYDLIRNNGVFPSIPYDKVLQSH